MCVCVCVHTLQQDQYVFVHDAILEAVTCGDTQIDASNLRTVMRKLKDRNQSGKTGFEHQFTVCLSHQLYTCIYTK